MLALAVATLAGCASDSGEPLTVDEFREQRPTEPVEVEGFLLIEGDDARLCASVAESYPPQCGGSFIELDAFDSAAVAEVVTSEGDVSWLESAVVALSPVGDGAATFLSIVDP